MKGPTFSVVWSEDSNATVLGRITARDGSGDYTGKRGEGNWLQQSDLTSITYKVFDEDSSTPDTEIASGTVTIADSVLDTPVTNGQIWTKDNIGYNFQHDLAASNFPTGGRRYRVEYRGETTGGTVFHASYRGIARPIRSS